jgi:biotin carboxylase
MPVACASASTVCSPCAISSASSTKDCQPAFQVVRAGAGGQALARAAAGAGFPCVVKAVPLSGSQGVLRANDEAGAINAATRIRSVLAAAARPAGASAGEGVAGRNGDEA